MIIFIGNPFIARVIQRNEYFLTTSQRGMPKLLHEGYSYVVRPNKTTPSTRYWKCSKNARCYARMILKENGILLYKKGHNHPP